MSFIPFSSQDSTIFAEKVVRPAWSGDVTTLNNFFIPTLPDNDYYLPVYAESPSVNPLAEPQFSISYGHVSGSGSIISTGDGTGASKLIYGQQRSLLLQTESGSFSFMANGTVSPDIFVLGIYRERYKEKLREGSLTLTLRSGSSYLSLTDYLVGGVQYAGTTRYYHLVSGALGTLATGETLYNTASGSYGWVFPDKGLIVLNPNALALSVGNKGIGLVKLTSGLSRVNNNPIQLHNSIKLGTFRLNSEETVTSQVLQATVNMAEFNHTSNPTVISSDGTLLFNSMVDNPETFITTVGLYNDSGELLAVAKLNHPQRKNSVTKTTFPIKLSW